MMSLKTDDDVKIPSSDHMKVDLVSPVQAETNRAVSSIKRIKRVKRKNTIKVARKRSKVTKGSALP